MARNNQSPSDRATAKVRVHIRRYAVLELILEGGTYREVAARVGVSHTQVQKDLRTAMSEISSAHLETAKEIRDLNMARYNRLLMTWWPKAIGEDSLTSKTMQPDFKATGRVLTIIKAIRKLWNLEKLEPTPAECPTQPNCTDGQEDMFKGLSDEDHFELDMYIDDFMAKRCRDQRCELDL